MIIHKPSGLGKREEREFVDREECIDLFKDVLKNVKQKEHSVLVYYGIAGSGKTSLIRKLLEITEEYNYYNHHKIDFAFIDLTTKTYLNKSNFLFILRNELHRKYGVKFRFFDYAYETYWNKTYPTTPLKKENSSVFYEIGLDGISKIFKESRYIDFLIPPLAIFAIEKATESFKKWHLEREREIRDLLKMTPTEIEEQLHLYWAWDLITYLHKTANTVALFIDTYENLEKQQDSVVLHSEDEWIRDLVEGLPNTLWVIGGKNKLQWGEVNPKFRNCLQQKKIEEFTEEYSINFLNSCKIEDMEIQKRIIESSRGLPFYLNLSVDTYWNIMENEGRQPSQDDFAKVREKVSKQFINSVKPSEENTIITLSIPNFWNYDLFEVLVKKFNLKCEASDFPRICHYSFVDQKTENCWCMHNLMRESLQEYQNQEQKRRIHNFLFNYYDKKLNGIESCEITEEQKEALSEAFYHGKLSLDSHSLLDWFLEKAIFFYYASLWNNILPLYEEILEIIKEDFGNEHPVVPHILNNLGATLINMRRIEEAKQRFEEALNIRFKLFSQNPKNEDYQLEMGITLNNFGFVLSRLGEKEEAKYTLEGALLIREDLVSRHPDNVQYQLSLERTLLNLANLLSEVRKEEARQKYEEALKKCEKLYTFDSENTENQYIKGNILKNLGSLLSDMGINDDAKLKYGDAVKIYENLTLKYPENVDFKSDLASTLSEIGDFLSRMEKDEEASQRYEQSLMIWKNLLDIDPENTQEYQFHVGGILSNFGILSSKMGRLEEAEQKYLESIKVREDLLSKDSTNIKHLSDMGVTLNNLGNLLKKMGSLNEAEKNYQRAIDIYEELLNIKEKNIEYRLNMSKFLENYGDLLLNVGKKEKARQKLEKALKIREEVLNNDQKIEFNKFNVRNILNNLREISKILNTLGNLLSKIGEKGEAKRKYKETIEKYEKVLERYKNLLKADPTNREYQAYMDTVLLYLGVISNNFGYLLQKMGVLKEARMRYQRSIDIFENLSNTNEKSIEYKVNLSQSIECYGDLLLSVGKREKARQKFERALKIREEVLNNEQTNLGNEFEGILSNLEETSRILNNLATLLSKMGRTEEANQRYEETLKKYEKAREHYINLLKADPTNEKCQLYVGTTIFYLSVVLSEMGRHEEAMRRMDEMLQMKKEGIQIKYAQPSPHPIVFDYP